MPETSDELKKKEKEKKLNKSHQNAMEHCNYEELTKINVFFFINK